MKYKLPMSYSPLLAPHSAAHHHFPAVHLLFGRWCYCPSLAHLSSVLQGSLKHKQDSKTLCSQMAQHHYGQIYHGFWTQKCGKCRAAYIKVQITLTRLTTFDIGLSYYHLLTDLQSCNKISRAHDVFAVSFLWSFRKIISVKPKLFHTTLCSLYNLTLASNH